MYPSLQLFCVACLSWVCFVLRLLAPWGQFSPSNSPICVWLPSVNPAHNTELVPVKPAWGVSTLVCAVGPTNTQMHVHTHTHMTGWLLLRFYHSLCSLCSLACWLHCPKAKSQYSSVCMDFTLCHKSELGFSFCIFRVHIFVKPQNLYQEYSEIRCREEWLQRGDTYDFRHNLAGSFQAICYMLLSLSIIFAVLWEL